MQITLQKPDNAPCCFEIITARGQTCLVQTDYDYPGVAVTFGWTRLCNCGATDGTVDCAHMTAQSMMDSAREYLVEQTRKDNWVEDPGYFGG